MCAKLKVAWKRTKDCHIRGSEKKIREPTVRGRNTRLHKRNERKPENGGNQKKKNSRGESPSGHLLKRNARRGRTRKTPVRRAGGSSPVKRPQGTEQHRTWIHARMTKSGSPKKRVIRGVWITSKDRTVFRNLHIRCDSNWGGLSPRRQLYFAEPEEIPETGRTGAK